MNIHSGPLISVTFTVLVSFLCLPPTLGLLYSDLSHPHCRCRCCCCRHWKYFSFLFRPSKIESISDARYRATYDFPVPRSMNGSVEISLVSPCAAGCATSLNGSCVSLSHRSQTRSLGRNSFTYRQLWSLQ